MPYEWTEPELYLEHPNGVKVWHTYKGYGGAMGYWFTTCESDDDVESGSEYIFDVRELPEPVGECGNKTDDEINALKITRAIDTGLLPLPESNQPEVVKEIPEFAWPTCPQCGKEIDVSRVMSGDCRAGCGRCNDRDGYALDKTHRGALVKYLNREVCD